MIYESNYTKEELDAGIGAALLHQEDAYSAIRLLFGIGWGGYTVNEVSNVEWQKALLDSQDKVIAGIKADGSFWTAELS